MLLDCVQLEKSFADNLIVKDASFKIEENEKVALVGVNGCGKTTLIKMIIGELDSDKGQIIINKNANIGYLSQNSSLESSLSVYEEVFSTRSDLPEMENSLRTIEQDMNVASGDELERLMKRYATLSEAFERAGGYEYRSRVVGVLKGMGFDETDFTKKINVLSGGEKTRVALGKLLLMPLDLLILDEPTNHLDLEAVAWLEGFLASYQGALLLVSHDRYFLNKTVNKVIEIDNAKLRTFKGNYDEYSKKKKELISAAIKAYNNQQREIEKQEKVIETLRSFNREKSIKRAESRVKMLDKIERLEKVEENTSQMRISFTPTYESGKDVLHVENVSKAFDENVLFTDCSFDIYRGDKIALIGENGAGKTTLIKLLLGQCAADQGLIKFGTNVSVAYFDQEHAILDKDKTIFEEISDSYPELNQTKIRNTMAAFMFTEDDVFSKIGYLSGGEQGRVALAKLMLSNANFLILDEPTNHLDILSKEILEEAVKSYEGTILYISHDRYFINQTATRIFQLSEKKISQFVGNYDEFIEKTKNSDNIAVEKNSGKLKMTDSKESWLKQKEESNNKRKTENAIKKIQKRLDEIESRKNELNEMLNQEDIASSYSKLNEITNEINELTIEEDRLFEEWDSLS